MKTGFIIAEVDSNGHLNLDKELKNRLKLNEGDKVELTIKKIISRKSLNANSENPLYELTK